MLKKFVVLLLVIFFVTVFGFQTLENLNSVNEQKYFTHIVDLKQQEIKFYWKNSKGEVY